jgi:hypothetical protein
MKLTGNRCKCPSCGQYFNSTYAFDTHRIGTFQPMRRMCLTPEQMIEEGMAQSAKGFWISHARIDPSAPQRDPGVLRTNPLRRG